MTLGFELGMIAFASLMIYYIGKAFASASSNIGDYLRLPRSVKGATFDAVSSSAPELLVALFAVIFFKQFEVGIGTIAGSALFNLLVIPGICVLVAPVTFKVGREVVRRDAMFYIIAVFALMITVVYFKTWGLGIALLFIALYIIYILKLRKHSKRYQRKNKKKEQSEINISKEILIFITTLFLIAVATFFLTDSSIKISTILGISPIIIAFTITAAATSVPDTVISVVNAKKGDIDDATSNVFGSNTFDILIGLGLPLLIYFFIAGEVTIIFENLEIIFGLMGATILLLFFFADDNKLSKKEGIILLILYLLFILYVVHLSIL